MTLVVKVETVDNGFIVESYKRIMLLKKERKVQVAQDVDSLKEVVDDLIDKVFGSKKKGR